MNDHPHDQLWSEDIQFPGHGHTLEINADSYNQWVREWGTALGVDPSKLSDAAFERGSQQTDVFCPKKSTIRLARQGTSMRLIDDLGGGWKFGVRTLPYYKFGAVDWLQMGLVRNRLAVYQNEYDCAEQGAVMFTGPVHIPMVVQGWQVWMSLTPMEVYTLREAIQISKGRVLIAGLGLGWLTSRILEEPEVKHVTQLELEPSVAQRFGEPLQQIHGSRLDIIVGDVYDYLAESGVDGFDTIIFDIWQSYGAAYDDKDFQNIKESHSNVWGWGDIEGFCDDDDYTYEDQDEDGFDNDQACWGKENPREWWNLG